MTVRYLRSYRLDITPLSPLHLGTGETYDPTGYVIDSGALCAFNPEDAIAACTADDRKKLSHIVSKPDGGAVLREIQRFFFERRERLVPRASHFVPVRKANEDYYERRVGKETNPDRMNLLDIERTAYDSMTGRAVLPGSGIKGAIRTALLDRVNGGRPTASGENNVALQRKLFGFEPGKFELDPMRLIQIGDASLQLAPGLSATEIRFALNRKKRRVEKDGNEVVSQAPRNNLSQVLETVRPLMARAFRGRLTVQTCDGLGEGRFASKLPRQDLRWVAEDVARACSEFYVGRFGSDLTILKSRRFVDADWATVVEALLRARKKQCDEGRAFLLRVGRHSGAESVTLNGVRRIKILQGEDPATRRRQSSEEPEAKTLWLAGNDPQATTGLLPFGWVFVEITPDGAEPPPWTEAFDQHHASVREWHTKLEARVAELRSQQANDEQRRAAEAERGRLEAEARAAEEARLAAMSPEERRIMNLRVRFEQAKLRRETKAGGPVAQLFNEAIETARSWAEPDRKKLIPLLEEINKFLEGDRKKRQAKIKTLE